MYVQVYKLLLHVHGLRVERTLSCGLCVNGCKHSELCGEVKLVRRLLSLLLELLELQNMLRCKRATKPRPLSIFIVCMGHAVMHFIVCKTIPGCRGGQVFDKT